MSASVVDWPGIRASAVAVGVREAARRSAAHLPDDERERFVFRVLKRSQREGWVVGAKATRAAPVARQTAGPMSSNVLTGGDVLDDERARAPAAAYPLDRAIETALRPLPGDGDGDGDGFSGSGEQPPALVFEARGDASPLPRAPARTEGPSELVDTPPESVAERLAGLPQWQARYVLALMECGGIEGLACGRCNISRRSVARAQYASSDFIAACAEAVEHSTDLVEAASYRGATVGDLQPIYQGGLLVGYKRVRSVKDTELILKMRGRLRDAEQEPIRRGKVQLVTDEEMPAVLAEVTARLFAARQQRVVDV